MSCAAVRRKVWEHMRCALGVIEPWYDWGRYSLLSVKDNENFDGWHFDIQWLRFQISIQVGRQPKREGK